MYVLGDMELGGCRVYGHVMELCAPLCTCVIWNKVSPRCIEMIWNWVSPRCMDLVPQVVWI